MADAFVSVSETVMDDKNSNLIRAITPGDKVIKKDIKVFEKHTTYKLVNSSSYYVCPQKFIDVLSRTLAVVDKKDSIDENKTEEKVVSSNENKRKLKYRMQLASDVSNLQKSKLLEDSNPEAYKICDCFKTSISGTPKNSDITDTKTHDASDDILKRKYGTQVVSDLEIFGTSNLKDGSITPKHGPGKLINQNKILATKIPVVNSETNKISEVSFKSPSSPSKTSISVAPKNLDVTKTKRDPVKSEDILTKNYHLQPVSDEANSQKTKFLTGSDLETLSTSNLTDGITLRDDSRKLINRNKIGETKVTVINSEAKKKCEVSSKPPLSSYKSSISVTSKNFEITDTKTHPAESDDILKKKYPLSDHLQKTKVLKGSDLETFATSNLADESITLNDNSRKSIDTNKIGETRITVVNPMSKKICKVSSKRRLPSRNSFIPYLLEDLEVSDESNLLNSKQQKGIGMRTSSTSGFTDESIIKMCEVSSKPRLPSRNSLSPYMLEDLEVSDSFSPYMLENLEVSDELNLLKSKQQKGSGIRTSSTSDSTDELITLKVNDSVKWQTAVMHQQNNYDLILKLPKISKVESLSSRRNSPCGESALKVDKATADSLTLNHLENLVKQEPQDISSLQNNTHGKCIPSVSPTSSGLLDDVVSIADRVITDDIDPHGKVNQATKSFLISGNIENFVNQDILFEDQRTCAMQYKIAGENSAFDSLSTNNSHDNLLVPCYYLLEKEIEAEMDRESSYDLVNIGEIVGSNSCTNALARAASPEKIPKRIHCKIEDESRCEKTYSTEAKEIYKIFKLIDPLDMKVEKSIATVSVKIEKGAETCDTEAFEKILNQMKHELLEGSEYDLDPEIYSSLDVELGDELKTQWMSYNDDRSHPLVPTQSKPKYEKAYWHFMEWLKCRDNQEISEDTMLAYFIEKSEHFKSSTLWSMFSMIKSTLMAKDNVDIGQFKKLLALLKHKNKGYVATQSKVFTKEQLQKFLKEAPDKTYLMMKVALIIGISGGCRRDELAQLTIDQVEDMGGALLVKINDSKTKLLRSFTVIPEEAGEMNSLQIYRKYISLRPENLKHRRFFIAYRAGTCTSQVVGVNTFGKIPSKVAQYLKLPEPEAYNGHAFRRSSMFLTKTDRFF